MTSTALIPAAAEFELDPRVARVARTLAAWLLGRRLMVTVELYTARVRRRIAWDGPGSCGSSLTWGHAS